MSTDRTHVVVIPQDDVSRPPVPVLHPQLRHRRPEGDELRSDRPIWRGERREVERLRLRFKRLGSALREEEHNRNERLRTQSGANTDSAANPTRTNKPTARTSTPSSFATISASRTGEQNDPSIAIR